VSEARVMQANRPELAASYNAEVRGVPGNGAGKLMEHGDFGPRVPSGGNGLAEYRYLETAELVTRQFMRGSAWGWKTFHPDLATDYLPYPDEALHTFLGFASPSTPGVSAAARANAKRMLKRAYSLVDRYLEQLESFAAKDPNTRLFVTGEHGMRPTWMSFRPNVVLAKAGLVVVDTAGKINLNRTRAAAANGGWVAVNRATRRGGFVPADSVEPILERAAAALLAARDSAGRPIVTRVFRANTVEGDSLGIGGPAGGDLYWSLAPGYYWSPITTGPAVVPLAFPQGEHGFPSIDRDMHPALCILGGGKARRIGEVRSIDIAPSVAAWLGIAPPGDARGKSLLPK
jgi:predicted AlkP superfamily phosphohydrolase/phosphomutase